MTRDLLIRPLARDDDRTRFESGDPAIDRFLQHYAGQNQFKLHVGVTYVAEVARRIVGYATITGGSIERKHLPPEDSPRRLPAYPLPILRLARLGVDKSMQGHGIGRALTRHVLRTALAMRDTTGCVGVVVDAKSEAVSFYAALGFKPFATIREGRLHGGAEPLFLAIDTIAKAIAQSS